MSEQPSKRDVYKFLKRVKKSQRALSLREEDHFIVARAEAEALVKTRSDFGGHPIILLSAAEDFLRKWRWRWWRYAALIGRLIVTLDSALSLKEQVLPCPQEAVSVEGPTQND